MALADEKTEFKRDDKKTNINTDSDSVPMVINVNP